MKRPAIALVFLLCCNSAFAASRFWVPLTITGAVSGTGSLCRLTVNDTTNLTAGNAVVVAGILGAVACDGTTTVTTVVDATHVEVNLTFGLAYTSGGTLAGGNWTATGTGNWSATSGGAGGQSVPVAADTVTFDNASNATGATIALNFGGLITLVKFNMQTNFLGTWDNSVNNNNITVTSNDGSSAFVFNGGASSTYKLGSATYTLSGNSTRWQDASAATTTAGTSTISFTGTTGTRTFTGNDKTYSTLSFATSSGAGIAVITGNNTFTNVTIAAPNVIQWPGSSTNTITGAVTWAGTSTSPIELTTTDDTLFSTISVAASSTMNWSAIRGLHFTTNVPIASNSFNLGNNSGVTINAPSSGGGCIISGWLLYRDMPENINDNFPVWLEKAA